MRTFLFIGILLQSALIFGQEQAKDTTKYDYVGLAIDSTLFEGKVSYMNQIFDKKSILDKVLLESEDKEIKEFNKGFKQGLMKAFNYGERIKEEIGETGSFDFLRSRINENGEYHLLFRLSGDDGINYHDYKIQELKGEVKICDVYIYMSGEYISKTLSDLYRAAIASRTSSAANYFGQSLIKDLPKVTTIKAQMSSGNYQKAFELFNTLSKNSKQQKAIQIIGIQLAFEISEIEYQKAIQTYEESFPNDPSLYLISMDGAFLSGDYDKVLDLIDKLDRAIDGDPFLDSYRANIYFAKKDLDTALLYANRMYESYPLFADSHGTLIAVLVARKEYDKAVTSLKKFYATFGLSKEMMKETVAQEYPELVQSEVYQNFLKEE